MRWPQGHSFERISKQERNLKQFQSGVQAALLLRFYEQAGWKRNMDAEKWRSWTLPDSFPSTPTLPFSTKCSPPGARPVRIISTSSHAVWLLFELNKRKALAGIRRREGNEMRRFISGFSFRRVYLGLVVWLYPAPFPCPALVLVCRMVTALLLPASVSFSVFCAFFTSAWVLVISLFVSIHCSKDPSFSVLYLLRWDPNWIKTKLVALPPPKDVKKKKKGKKKVCYLSHWGTEEKSKKLAETKGFE